MNKTYDEFAEEAITLTAEIINKHGPRISGTAGCENAGKDLEKILAGYCTSIKRESFGIHPGSMLLTGKIFAVAYVIGLIAILTGNKICIGIGLISMIIGGIYILIQFILYLDLFDVLFKKGNANNVFGIIEPKNTVKQQVIIVSHYDSSHVFPFYEKLPLLFAFRLFIPVLLFLFCLVVLFISLFFHNPVGTNPFLPIWIKYILLFGLILVLPIYGFISKRKSPGAGDNLISCAIGIKLAEIFQNDENALQNTRIVVLLTDGEELGMKGAKFFIKNNSELINSSNTIVINNDTFYKVEDIALVKRDRNGFTKLSTDLINDIKSVAMELGHSFRTVSIPFGGGGTDGVQFALKKIRTISIIGISVKFFRKEILLHTPKDTVDKISKNAVSTVIEVVSEYIRKRDISQPNSFASDQ